MRLIVRVGLLAGLVAGLLMGIATPAMAQISPGELSEAHAHLEGSSRCLDCHAPRQGVAPARCLDCHDALRRRVESGEGLHAQSGFQSCESCHIEHHGRDFELIYWDDVATGGRDAFDHDPTGWPLVGAHTGVGCRDCHRLENLRDPGALRAGKADPESTYLGLSTTCRSCHDDEHRGQFVSRSCNGCHSTTAWTPAPGFDHDTTDFPLVGSHDGVACAQCHDTESDAAGDFRRFAGVAYAACTDCHQDPHRGRLGPTCSDCHTATDWRRVDTKDFDHSRTRFPLTGQHRGASCQSCHRGGSTQSRLAFESCSDCHRDPHRARLGSTCSSCHNTSSWNRVAEGTFDHEQTRFPLRGEHVDVACSGCHEQGRRVGERLDFDACSDCHGDPHLGQLRFALSGGEPRACADCHDEDGFVPSSFGVREHQATTFPLDGAHLAIACVDCHLLTEPEALAGVLAEGFRFQRSSGRSATQPIRRFRFSATGCEACHGDPHEGKTAGAACADCHSTSTFRRVTAGGESEMTFDHGQATGFDLVGAHADVACASCHEGRASSSGAVHFGPVDFDAAASTCASCHADPHFGARADSSQVSQPVDCASCHRPTDWRETSFDHARDARFALEGAHGRLACSSCHVRAGATVMKPPTTCEGCHDGSFISASSSNR